jgi:hypothetical protein
VWMRVWGKEMRIICIRGTGEDGHPSSYLINMIIPCVHSFVLVLSFADLPVLGRPENSCLP